MCIYQHIKQFQIILLFINNNSKVVYALVCIVDIVGIVDIVDIAVYILLRKIRLDFQPAWKLSSHFNLRLFTWEKRQTQRNGRM